MKILVLLGRVVEIWEQLDSIRSAGTQTAALGAGGYTTTFCNATEEYNGSTWTAGGNLGTAKYALAGTQTAAFAAGGGSPGFYNCNRRI
jgi:hypothetical protein